MPAADRASRASAGPGARPSSMPRPASTVVLRAGSARAGGAADPRPSTMAFGPGPARVPGRGASTRRRDARLLERLRRRSGDPAGVHGPPSRRGDPRGVGGGRDPARPASRSTGRGGFPSPAEAGGAVPRPRPRARRGCAATGWSRSRAGSRRRSCRGATTPASSSPGCPTAPSSCSTAARSSTTVAHAARRAGRDGRRADRPVAADVRHAPAAGWPCARVDDVRRAGARRARAARRARRAAGRRPSVGSRSGGAGGVPGPSVDASSSAGRASSSSIPATRRTRRPKRSSRRSPPARRAGRARCSDRAGPGRAAGGEALALRLDVPICSARRERGRASWSRSRTPSLGREVEIRSTRRPGRRRPARLPSAGGLAGRRRTPSGYPESRRTGTSCAGAGGRRLAAHR